MMNLGKESRSERSPATTRQARAGNPQAIYLAALLTIAFAVGVLVARPASAQETAGPFLRMLAVVDAAYPTVTAVVDVRDENGAPVTELDASNLAIEAGGQAVETFSVDQDTEPGLNLVLALDQSTSADNWAQTQAMVDDALSLLRPQDRVAITVFADEVELVQDFTSDFALASAAMAEAAPSGNFSASYPAMMDAVERLTALDSARGAVIVVADAPDNISQQTPADVIAAAQAAGVSIAVASYGPGQNVDAYDESAAATGGRRADAAAIGGLQGPVVQWVNNYLPAWRVTFESPIPGDGQSYPLIMTYSTAAGTAEAQMQFTAEPGEVTVAWLGLSSGQAVSGIVDLFVEAVTSGTIAQVEYRVDGQTIGVAETLDPFPWDTATIAPGAHTLEVEVTDSAGNVGTDAVQVQVIQPSLRLSVAEVNSEEFPQVVAVVDAFGPNGLPLVELDPNAFALAENGIAVSPGAPAGALTVEPDTSQPLGIVLALDRSVSVADWAQLRTAANALIDALRPGDEVAIYAFAQDVTLVQNATANHGAAKAALAAIDAAPSALDAAEGTNALYPALLDAVNLAGILSQSRVAVIAVAAGPDDTGSLTTEQLAGVLAGQDVPLHLLAFGAGGESAATFAGLAQLTGGHAATVNSAADVRTALQSLATLLQSGYRLTYASGLAADGGTHELAITLTAQGQETTATATFVAIAREVIVAIPAIEPGATVAGSVSLAAEADAPAPITSVVYRLNGDVLAEVENIDFTIMWNSDTVAPGPYTLEVVVTDAAGNVGQTAVDFVVVAPIVLSVDFASPAQADGVEVGERVDLTAQVQAVNEGVRVEAAVNGLVVGTADRPPYQISFGTADLTPGAHTITVVARDGEGYQAVEELSLTLAAAAGDAASAAGATTGDGNTGASDAPVFLGGITPPQVTVWQILRWIGIIAVALALLAVLWWLLAMLMRSRRERKLTPVRMMLSNMGNASTAYLLRGEDDNGVLTFEFWLNGQRLGLPPVARLESGPHATANIYRESAPIAATGQSAYAPAPVQQPGPQATNGDYEMVGEDGQPLESGEHAEGGGGGIGGALDRVREAGMVASIVASILTSIAIILPRNIGRPLRQLAMSIRRSTMVTRRVTSVQRQVKRLNRTQMGAQLVEGTQQGASQLRDVATSDATRQAVYSGAQGAMAAASATATAAAGAGAATAQRSAGAHRARLYDLSGAVGQARHAAAGAIGNVAGAWTGAGDRKWIYVPQLQPGESVTLDILVGGVGKNVATRHYPFRLVSRALDDDAATRVVEEGSVRIQGASWWRRHLGVIVGVLFFLVAVLAALIWLF